MASESSTDLQTMGQMKQIEADYGLNLLASTLAHEIRNPLQTIRLQLDAVQRGASLGSTLQSISESLARLESVVSRVQQLGQRYVLSLENVHLRELMDSTLSAVSFWLTASNVRATSDLQWEGEPILKCDQELLQQVLLNLCMNAVQAMPKGGLLEFSIYEEMDHAVFEISDTGEGISEETLRRIGTPFFTTKANGSGLGLAFCKTIATLHGGSLDLESTKGVGTKVTLRIAKSNSTACFKSTSHQPSEDNIHA